MNYQTFQPSPHLTRYVRSFWVYEGEASNSAPYIYRGFADDFREFSGYNPKVYFSGQAEGSDYLEA